ncbi:U-box domain-containing protein 9-like [Malania oleifera]|uniref:U-box domain-containing protein 9-like n=1 Tax=Malania oleifera TaxID=397392 RepID=UPI0025ADEB20|nr:U-box domain-containing protein 9-like [Malania oleifera]
MAKAGVMYETDSSMEAKAGELKKELQRLVKSIADDDDFRLDAVREAMRVLSALRDLKKAKRSISFNLDNLTVPDEFRCPISKELMRDPVVLASGETYDKPFIQKWLNEGNRTCPQTQQVLSHTILTPNLLVREMISKWCKDHGIEQPPCVWKCNEEVFTDADRNRLNSLLEKMSSSLSVQKEAAKELRQLTKRMPSFRGLFVESTNAIPQLLSPLSAGRTNLDPDLQEDLITTVLNLAIHDSNKQIMGENPLVIPLLNDSLKSGSIETRSNAAAALFTLSALDSNKIIIGESGSLKHLVDLLDEGNPLAMKDAASAIFNLCIMIENKGRAVHAGAVPVILKKIMDRVLVDELLAILAMLSSHQKAVEEMTELGAVPCLLSIMRENNCERNKENSVSIIYTICFYDRSKLKEVREDEDKNGTISTIARTGTSRAKRKANGVLERLNKVTSITHTA